VLRCFLIFYFHFQSGATQYLIGLMPTLNFRVILVITFWFFEFQIWIVAILLSIPLWFWSSVDCVCGFHVPKDLLFQAYVQEAKDLSTNTLNTDDYNFGSKKDN